jgi:hypothetical protein
LSSTEVTHAAGPGRAGERKALRHFGLIVGGAFGVVAVWPTLFRGAAPRWWVLAVAVVLALAALLAPRSLAVVHRMWMGLAEILGRINSVILLSVVFYLVVTPMGVVMRLAGKDSMCRGFDRAAPTYRVRRRPRPATHMTRQF